MIDITQKPTPVRFSRLAEQLLALLGSAASGEQLINDIILRIQVETGVESVGIRLKRGLDFPYYFTQGFSPEFVHKEMYLCAHDQAGELIRDSNGDPHLECMCGNVICGRTDASLPFFTANGSFWTNSTTDLLASTTDQERQTKTRNRCNRMGYESMVLIPIRANNAIHGLVQLNDRRRDLFTEEFVVFMEGAAANIGLLFLMVQQKEALARQAEDLHSLVSVRTTILERIAESLREISLAVPAQPRYTSALDTLQSVLAELDRLQGILPICMRCKGIRNDAGSWERVEKYICDRTRADFTHTYCPECYTLARQEQDQYFAARERGR